jgi:hypothetical protein
MIRVRDCRKMEFIYCMNALSSNPCSKRWLSTLTLVLDSSRPDYFEGI